MIDRWRYIQTNRNTHRQKDRHRSVRQTDKNGIKKSKRNKESDTKNSHLIPKERKKKKNRVIITS